MDECLLNRYGEAEHLADDTAGWLAGHTVVQYKVQGGLIRRKHTYPGQLSQ